jgi:glycosyltransferase involved in cell wall biosynthesis
VPYPPNRAPGQRYRLEQWSSHLESLGISVTLSSFLADDVMRILYRRGHLITKTWGTLRGYIRRFRDARRGRGFQVIYVYREATPFGPVAFERVMADAAPVVFDFDDAIYLPSVSAANDWIVPLRGSSGTPERCRIAAHVVVGNESLADFARSHADRVSVVPSTIDTTVYVVRARRSAPRPVIGWTGSVTTIPHLEALGPALRELRRNVDFELRVIGGVIDLPGVDVTCVPWRAETEVEDLRPLDVGIMPLPDDPWSRGKCGMKALQYMGLAIPPVVSPVGANRTIVQDGVNGLHAREPADWVNRLTQLLEDNALRARLGAAARLTVEAEYSAEVQAPRFARIVGEAATTRRP